MKKMYLIGLIVLVEALILGSSASFQKKTALITAPKKQIKKKIECRNKFTIIAKINETFYQYPKHYNIPDPDRIVLNVSNYSLSINKQRLRKLPNELLTARCIKRIYIKRNFLREFPTQLLEQPFLEMINLSNNDISMFPNIERPTAIKSLRLSGNQKIKEIPSSIKFFTNLEYLYLNNIKSLESIHDNIKHLKKLKKLGIKNTPIAKAHHKVLILKKLLPNTEIIIMANQNKKR